MSEKIAEQNEYCLGCVYFPPNLPRQAYALEDWRILQARRCSFEYTPEDTECLATRKTSCGLVELSDSLQRGGPGS